MESEEQAFLEAIRANPDDDAPRLIFADWLIEQGDLRGEFIQVQCELERTRESDPRRQELANRDRRMRDHYGYRWKRHISHLNTINVGFKRGFIEHVSMKAMFFVREAEMLFELCPTLRSVKLSIGNTDIQQVARSASLARVHRLDLAQNHLNDHVLEVLLQETQYLGSLQDLDLSYNSFRAEAAKTLAETTKLPNLKTLKLYNTHIGGEGVVNLLSPNLRGLESLDLGMNQVGAEGARALADSPYLENIERLFLSAHELDEESKQRLRRRFGTRLQLH